MTTPSNPKQTAPKRLPYVKAPCPDCPFRKDTLKGWLGRERMAGILEDTSFTCHKTGKEGKELKQCAGHMLIKGDANEFVWLSKAFNKPVTLTGRELVFDTPADCIDHHSSRRELEKAHDK